MAGWLTRKFDCRLWMTRLEYLNCRVLISDTGREAPPDAERFYRRAGWGEAPIENYRARFGNFGKQIHALPDSYRRIVDGEQIRIGRPRLARRRRQRPFARARLLLLPRAQAADLGRPGAAADLVERLGPSARARRQSDGRLVRVARQAQARGAGRRPGPAGAQRVLSRPARAARLSRGVAARGAGAAAPGCWPSRSGRSTSSRRSSAGRSSRPTPGCSAWRPAKASPASTTWCDEGAVSVRDDDAGVAWYVAEWRDRGEPGLRTRAVVRPYRQAWPTTIARTCR